MSRLPLSVLFSSAFALVSFVMLLALAPPANAGVINETEPNNTFDTANQLVGFNDLGLNATLTIGDIDNFTFFVQPAADGSVSFTYNDTWSPAGGLAADKWLDEVLQVPGSNNIFGGGMTGAGSTQSYNASVGVAGIYHLTFFSTTPNVFVPTPSSTSAPSQVAGSYTIRNLRGLNGTVVMGSAAAPEPSGLALLLPILPVVGRVLHRRKKH